MRVCVTSGPLGSLLGATVTSAVSGSMSAAVGLHRRLRAVAPLPAPPPAWRGSGPVVLVGGLCTTDAVLQPMRLWLERLGYQVWCTPPVSVWAAGPGAWKPCAIGWT